MSIDALHALTLNTDNVESSVTVNQRALIDKVLSRYSSENTLLRELLQNSDDANAKSVRIIYEASTTQSPDIAKDNIHKRMTKRVIVKNDGQVFRQEDWTRLSRIAEGNPDEAKIGAFGVGFYSVFSICEDPFVTSGATGLAFYWRKDQLFTRTATLPTEDKWTTFALNMRQESELPNLKNLTKFLVTSLTFSRSLSHIELWLDDLKLCAIDRVSSASTRLPIPSALTTATSGRMMKIQDLHSSSVQITATYLNSTQTVEPQTSASSKFFSFFSSSKQDILGAPDITASTTSQIFLRILTAAVTSNITASFSAELQRATKKPPPRTTSLQMVVFNNAEYTASTRTASIFENLLTFPKQGRVYIGFPTHQTTGFAAHIGAPCIIPTVERESIDLVDRFIKLWNYEVLRAIGLLARIAYHIEFSNVTTVEEAIHTIKLFSMHTATPQSIDETIEETFFDSSNDIPIYSTQGVQSSTTVRLPDPEIQFLQKTPILLPAVVQQASHFVDRLMQLKLVEKISIGDIRKDLQDRILSVNEAVEFLRYCAKMATDLDQAALSSLLRAGVTLTGNESSPQNLGDITAYIISKNIPDTVPLPYSCISSTLSSSLSLHELRLLGWSELAVLEWLRFLTTCSPIGRPPVRDINTDPEFATLVLSIVSKNFDAMTADDRLEATTLLKSRTCIPTRNHGMQQPDGTYFHTINMFEDLPLIANLKGVKERFLAALGVRKTIELSIIFDRLLNGSKWTTYDLIHYLSSVRKDIPARDIDRLKKTPLAAMEGSAERLCLNQLFAPSDELRALNLPILAWPKGRWKPSSDECSLLYALGLQKFPSAVEILRVAGTSQAIDVRECALKYFISNFVLYNYGASYNARTTSVAFIPTDSGELLRPNDVYSDPTCSIFHCKVLRQDLRGNASLLGVRAHPSLEQLAHLLCQDPPNNYVQAVAQYTYISKLQPSFTKGELERFGRAKVIPMEVNGSLSKMISPDKCFFKNENSDSIYNEIFDCVDFGVAANHFLRTIGVRDEPSISQLAGMLVRDAQSVLATCGNEERYISLLRRISYECSDVKKDRHLWQAMKSSRFLLAYRHVRSPKDRTPADANDNNDKDTIIQSSLQSAGDIVIVDDVIDYNMFRSEVYSCPQEQPLEELYHGLGSPRLSSIIVDSPTTSGPRMVNEVTRKIREEVVERLAVFLSEAPTKPKRDAREVAQNLSVVMQETLAIHRDLKYARATSSRHHNISALTLHEGPRITLVVSPKPEKYDIAVALCKVVLSPAKIGDYLLLDTLLSNSLETLQNRGYNVDRILHRQERERKEREMLELDKKRAILAENEQDSAAPYQIATPDMTDTSSHEPLTRNQDELEEPASNVMTKISKNSSLMSTIQKGLGIKKFSTERSPLASSPAQKLLDTQSNRASRGGKNIESQPRPTQTVTSQSQINQTLQKAIDLSRSSDDSRIFSQARVDQVVEARSFCDAKSSQNLVLALTLPNKMKLYINRHVDQEITMRRHSPTALKFSELLKQIEGVFRIRSGVINISYDEEGSTIAFNYSGAIYCNLRFFEELHHRPETDLESQSAATTYWYITIAHELAHNLVSEHSSEHEFYMEGLIAQYLPRLLPLFSSTAMPPTYVT